MPKKNPTDLQEEVALRHRVGEPVESIAKAMNLRGLKCVYGHLRRYHRNKGTRFRGRHAGRAKGIPAPYPERMEEIVRRLPGESHREIAKSMGLSVSRVSFLVVTHESRTGERIERRGFKDRSRFWAFLGDGRMPDARDEERERSAFLAEVVRRRRAGESSAKTAFDMGYSGEYPHQCVARWLAEWERATGEKRPPSPHASR